MGRGTACILAAALMLLAPIAARADLEPLSDTALSRVSGRAGISVAVSDLLVYSHWEHIEIQGSDQGNISFEGVTLSDGDGRPWSLEVGTTDADGDGRIDPATLDVGVFTDPASPAYGQAYLALNAPDMVQHLALHVDDLVWCGQSLGPLDLGPIQLYDVALRLAGHGDGLDFDLGLRLDVDQLAYTYNTGGQMLAAQGIHLAGDFTANPADDPADPATWQASGAFFVGDMASGQPATLDVGQVAFADSGQTLAAAAFSLPMQGSLRVENVHFGSQDFGPAVIDGLRVHVLNLYLVP